MNNKNYKSKTSDFALIKQLKTFITSIHTCRPSRPSSNSSKQTKYFQYKKTNIHCYNKNNIDIMLLNLIFYYDLFKSTKIVKKKYQKKKKLIKQDTHYISLSEHTMYQRILKHFHNMLISINLTRYWQSIIEKHTDLRGVYLVHCITMCSS